MGGQVSADIESNTCSLRGRLVTQIDRPVRFLFGTISSFVSIGCGGDRSFVTHLVGLFPTMRHKTPRRSSGASSRWHGGETGSRQSSAVKGTASLVGRWIKDWAFKLLLIPVITGEHQDIGS